MDIRVEGGRGGGSCWNTQHTEHTNTTHNTRHTQRPHGDTKPAQVLPENLQGAVSELAPYFVDSFGNATRIDYGTGHETTFVALLYCLAALGVVTEEDRVALVNTVFEKWVAVGCSFGGWFGRCLGGRLVE